MRCGDAWRSVAFAACGNGRWPRRERTAFTPTKTFSKSSREGLFDTNLLSYSFTSLGLCHEIYERTLLTASMVSCDPLLDELRGTLIQKMKVESTLADEIIAELRNEFELVEAKPLSKRVCHDADDDLVLATARESKADVIVTGDKDLLVLKEFQKTKILSPRQFIEMLDASIKE